MKNMRQIIDLITETAQPVPSITRLRSLVPAKFTNVISDNDLYHVYQIFREGHSLDGVQNILARSRVETAEAIQESLNTLADVSTNNFGLYRTIAVDDPKQWIKDNLTQSTNLGVYWSRNEEYTMAHEDAVAFYVEAPFQSVDWPVTIVIHHDGVETEIVIHHDGVETEIRLKSGSPVHLIYADPNDDGIKLEPKQFA